ncbi:DUF3000 domain-containing protein [Rhodococcus sp. X156]|uniref:DUF3000 domain-containing protein n=1 Tax=Rhodococcus sp. X156 TaxID=2499145 RepID=UPI000FD8502A|nr:DUF3000 domain-containing protein [Rhodococcus sp. X156]
MSGVLAQPEEFRKAVSALSAASARDEIELGPIRPPQKLAPYTYAIGAEVEGADGEHSEASGRLVLLHDPDGHDAWNGTLRLVAYIQAELDADTANDPLLPDVGWTWLLDALVQSGADYTALGGTVTVTSSVRFGDLAGPARTNQLELRASWTASTPALAAHADAFCAALSSAAGLPPLGVHSLPPRRD